MTATSLPTSINDCHLAFSQGTNTSESLTNKLLNLIDETNPSLRTYLSISSQARLQAAAIDRLRRDYPEALGPLAGIPISIKDLIDTEFLPTTYGSQAFEHQIPPRNALIVNRLQKAGAVILGKTNLHEFAYGVTNENEYFGNAANPVNPTRMTGGSSGGSAASVKARTAIASVGTDTGGSVRIPASWTGVVGYKPSFGMIPVTGVFPLAPTLDHVGPITHTVSDAALLTEVMSGRPLWPLSNNREQRNELAVRPLTVGIPRNLIMRFGHPDTISWFEKIITALREHGLIAKIYDIELPIDEISQCQGTIIGAEAYAVHAEALKSTAEKYGTSTFERIQASREVSAPQYMSALTGRQKIRDAIANWFSLCDVLMLPTTPLEAQPFGTRHVTMRGETHVLTQLLTRFTNPWNLTGLPAISLPMGEIHGLPIGLQLVGAHSDDAQLLETAEQVEQSEIFVQI